MYVLPAYNSINLHAIFRHSNGEWGQLIKFFLERELKIIHVIVSHSTSAAFSGPKYL